MTKSRKQIEKILDVIGLKRQRLEAEIAKLKRNDAKLLEHIHALSVPLEQSPQEDDAALSFAMTITRWTVWRERKKTSYQSQRSELGFAMREISQHLQRLNVQISALESQHASEIRLEKRYQENQLATQQLESWINAR